MFFSGQHICSSGLCSLGRNTNVVEVPPGSSRLMMVDAGGWETWGVGGHPSPSTAHISLSIMSLSFVSDKLPVAVGWEDDSEGASAHTGTCVTNYPDRTATPRLAAR